MSNPFGTPFGNDSDLGDDTDGLEPSAHELASIGRSGGTRPGLAIVFIGALVGCAFAATSTSDFVQHLDRQVHSISCSVVPGAGAEIGESGCRTVMMSPYSSLFRDQMWGGLPISLWAFAVFAFLAYRSLYLLLGGARRHDTFFVLAATLLPVLMSVIYGYISFSEIGTTCTVCVGIYVASGLMFFGALFAHLSAADDPLASFGGTFAGGFAEGVGYVAVLTLVYLMLAPAHDLEAASAGCGTLVRPEDTAGAMVHLDAHPGQVGAIDLLDPLCPACRAFEERLEASGFDKRLDRRSILFPLDSECNWMVKSALHPGACAVSEAILCAAGRVTGTGDAATAARIKRWAFDNQEELLAQAKADKKSVRRRLSEQFPSVKGCVGSAKARNKLTKGLRWAVANALPVLTPQLFVNGRRLCGEDTDLGLEYTLSAMLQSKPGAGPRASLGGTP